MKNIYFLLFILIGFAVQAQTLEILDGDSLYENKTVIHIDSGVISYNHVKNISTMTQNVNWRIDSVYNPQNWGLSLCDKDFCLSIVSGNETNTISLGAGNVSVLKAGYTPDGVAGTAYIKAKVVSIGVTEAASYVIYKADIDVDIPDAISTFETTTISIYPNPTASFINVSVVGSESIQKIVIYNVIGKVVEEINTISSLNTINVKNYDNGLYIIKLFGENDKLFHTQTFVKK